MEAALLGYSFSRDRVGRSRAEILCCRKGEERRFLKIEAVGEESLRERQMLHWLQDKLPVPRVVAEAEQAGRQYLLLSVFGGASHNIGQLIAARFIINNSSVWYYLPVLLAAGLLMGAVTGLALRVILPYLNRLKLK